MHVAEIMITLIISFILVLGGAFNPGRIGLDLFGFKSYHVSLPVFIFLIFLSGAAYVAFWTILERLKQSLNIRKLKKRIRELEEYLESLSPVKPENSEKSEEMNFPASEYIETSPSPAVSGNIEMPISAPKHDQVKPDGKLSGHAVIEKILGKFSKSKKEEVLHE